MHGPLNVNNAKALCSIPESNDNETRAIMYSASAIPVASFSCNFKSKTPELVSEEGNISPEEENRHKQHDRPQTCTETSTRLFVTTVGVEKQKILNIMRVCLHTLLSYPACKSHFSARQTRYFVTRWTSVCTNSFHIIS